MRLSKAVAGLIFLGSLCAPSLSQNDECATASAVPAGVTPFDTTLATSSAEPWPCALGGTDLWYTYTPVASGETLTIATCGSGYDTALEIFTGSCGGLVSVGCNDDSCGLQSSLMFAPTTAGVPVIFRVGGWNGASGTGIITISETMPVPSNNDCTAPILLVQGAPQAFDTTSATASAPAPMCGTGPPGPDLWYTFTPLTSGSVTVESCGSSFDTVIEFFFGPCNALVCITCWDDLCCEQAIGRLSNPIPGTEYLIRVSGDQGQVGSGSLILYQETTIAEEICGVDLAGNRLYTTLTNNFAPPTTVAPESRNFFGLDYDANATTLYAVDGDTGTRYRINGAVVGNPLPSGLPSPVGGAPWIDGLTAGPNGEWYAVQLNGSTGLSTLYGGDVEAGTFSAVGPIVTPPNTIIDIAMDSQGNLYGVSITDQMLYSISTSTGEGTAIGPLQLPDGFNLNFAQGMDFDWRTDTLFATLYTGSCDAFFATIETSTEKLSVGNATLLEPIFGEFEMAIAAPIGDQCMGLLDDLFEDNDDCSSAAAIGTGTLRGLTCGLLDPDSYAITLQPGELLVVALTDTATTDLDLNRFDAMCSQVATYDSDALAYQNTSPTAELVVFEVFVDPTSAGVGCLSYDMDVAITTGAACGTPDGLEDSDDCASAFALADGVYTGLNVEDIDNDYYEISVDNDATVTLDLFFIDALGDIDIYLWDPSVACDTNIVGTGPGAGALALGFSASDNEQVVYTNSSGASQTLIVEIDMFDSLTCNTYDLEISSTTPIIGTNYCMANPNSTGNTGVMSAFGSAVAADNNVQLVASGLPSGSFGYFIVSQMQGFLQNPNGSAGNVCISGSIGRYIGPGQILNTGLTDSFSLVLDLTMTPQPTSVVSVMAGDTWNYQAWHRDVVGGGAISNFTDGLQVVYQ